jgi:hypothetical protein
MTKNSYYDQDYGPPNDLYVIRLLTPRLQA